MAVMSDDFEDHCWKDVISPEVIEIYSAFKRKTFVGPDPALLAIDLYEAVYRGGAHPPHQLFKTYQVTLWSPSSVRARSTAPPWWRT